MHPSRIYQSGKQLPMLELALIGWLPSGIKRWIYTRRGYRIHPTVKFGFGSLVRGREVDIGAEVQLGMLSIVIGRNIKLAPRVRISRMAYINTFTVDIGENSRIGNQVVIGGMQSVHSQLRMGSNCIIMEWSFVNTTMPVIIGNDVGIGGHSLLFTHGLWPNTFEGFPANFAGITIEDEVWVAWRVSILPGVTIGKRSIISTDSCVVKDIPALCLAAGAPAKALRENGSYIRPVTDDDNKARLNALLQSYIEWCRFHGATVEDEQAHGFVLLDANGTNRLRLHLQPPNIVPPVTTGPRDTQLYISIQAIPPAMRQQLHQQQIAWIDVARRERSPEGNAAVDDVEDYLRRGGLRLLKYTARTTAS